MDKDDSGMAHQATGQNHSLKYILETAKIQKS